MSLENKIVTMAETIGADVRGLIAGKVDKVSGKGLSDTNFTQVEKTKLSGIATGATKNATDAQLRARASHTGVQAISTVTGLQAELDNKVGKVVGKELSANDFTNVLKTKLDSLPSGVGGLIPLSAGGTGATSAAAARTALQLDTAATKAEGYFALRAGTATQNFTTKEVSTVAANIRATTGSEGVKMEYNHTTKSLDFNFY